jgi:hypothetical protein
MSDLLQIFMNSFKYFLHVLQVVEEPYTMREARIHVRHVRDLLKSLDPADAYNGVDCSSLSFLNVVTQGDILGMLTHSVQLLGILHLSVNLRYDTQSVSEQLNQKKVKTAKYCKAESELTGQFWEEWAVQLPGVLCLPCVQERIKIMKEVRA